MVKNPPSAAGDMGSIPGQGIKFTPAAEQLSPCPHLLSSTQLESLYATVNDSNDATKILRAAIKSLCSQINKY